MLWHVLIAVRGLHEQQPARRDQRHWHRGCAFERLQIGATK
jgi:hypothetical protein